MSRVCLSPIYECMLHSRDNTYWPIRGLHSNSWPIRGAHVRFPGHPWLFVSEVCWRDTHNTYTQTYIFLNWPIRGLDSHHWPITGSGAGKSLLLSLLRDREFDTDTALVPTVGVNIFKVEVRTEGSKRSEVIDIRELGGQLAPVWADYVKWGFDLGFCRYRNISESGPCEPIYCQVCVSNLHKLGLYSKWLYSLLCNAKFSL